MSQAVRKVRMAPDRRNACWEDGEPLFLVADTAWALPFRATLEETRTFAQDRQSKGFNSALLMVVQPDMRAEGPEDRTLPDGFGRAFWDLPSGRLRDRNEAYFEHFDQQVAVLREHGIVPIFSPLFYGFGWKGLSVIGPVADPGEAADFARFLWERYGDGPAIWLVGADGTGQEPAVEVMGKAIKACDPAAVVAIHYNPWQASDAHWNSDWCDVHLCQTGHNGQHRPERVALMHSRTPVRGVANGEPTYEAMTGGRVGLDEWQSREAWLNLTAGGTFGCFYGAASLWQWKRHGDTGWTDWCEAPGDWRAALDFAGSRYPGVLGRLLQGKAFSGMSPDLELARAERCVSVPGRFGLVYLPDGRGCNVVPWDDEVPCLVADALTGETIEQKVLRRAGSDAWMGAYVQVPEGRACVLVLG